MPVAAAPAPAEQSAPGTWQISQNQAAASASFLSPDGKALLAITCDVPSKVLSLAVSSMQPGNQTFVLQAGGQAARLDTIADNNPADPHQMAAIAPTAPVFAGFSQPQGTIVVSQPGLSELRVPATTQIASVFAQCG